MAKLPVHQLINNGYMFIPIDSVKVDAAKAVWKWIMDKEKNSLEGVPITRRGEPESDLGHIIRAGDEGGDKKHFLHIAHDLCLYMTPFQRREFRLYEQEYLVLEDLRKHLNQVAFAVAQALDQEYEDTFVEPLLSKVKRSTDTSTPYATTTLRSLWYPPDPDQTGAGNHIDRNLFSIHVGDSGGQLLGFEGGEFGPEFVITPPPGYAVVFFGVKVLYLTDGRIMPLWHGSTVESGKPRTAMVQFVQADIGFEVPRARDAYNAFYESRER